MPVKTIRNSSTTVTNTTWLSGNINNQYVENVPDYVVADAEWSRLKPPPPLKTTPMVITEYRRNSKFYDNTRLNPQGRRTGRSGTIDHAYPGALDSFPVNDDGNDASNKALSKFTNRRGTFGEGLIEARSTANLIQKRTRMLYGIALALKRGDIGFIERMIQAPLSKGSREKLNGMNATGRLARGHLEFMFGVMPIITSIGDAAKIYNDGLLTNGQNVRSRSGNQSPFTGYTREDYKAPTGSASFRGKVKNSRIANANSMGLFNIPLEVWNAVPLSFVFDWVGNVGITLGAITGGAGLELWGTKTSVAGFTNFKKPSTGVSEFYTHQMVITRMRTLPLVSMPASWQRASSFSFGKVVTIAALARGIFPR